MGTSASCVGDAMPAPTLNRTRCATANNTTNTGIVASNGTTGAGPTTARPSTAASSAAAVIASATRSRRPSGCSARGRASRMSASTSGCDSIVVVSTPG
jgi:hypothetical protein